jgi:hypothetical protein
VVFYELLTGELPLGRFALPSQKLEVNVKVDEVVLKTLAKEPALRYQSASAVRTDVDGIARAPAPAPASVERRGCIGGLFHRVAFAFNPAPTPRKRLYGMELTSNWIPLGLASFLWFTSWISDNPLLIAIAIVGSVLIVRNTK